MDTQDLSFNEALKALKEIAAKLEDTENLDLEKGLELIEKGLKLHKLCKAKLENAQIKLTKLFEQEEAGVK